MHNYNKLKIILIQSWQSHTRYTKEKNQNSKREPVFQRTVQIASLVHHQREKIFQFHPELDKFPFQFLYSPTSVFLKLFRIPADWIWHCTLVLSCFPDAEFLNLFLLNETLHLVLKFSLVQWMMVTVGLRTELITACNDQRFL